MPEYNINITVSGKDRASPALKGVGGALSSMGKIAGGIITAKIFTKIATGILNLGKQAISSTANLQAMQVGLEGLLAREIAVAGGFGSISAALPEAQKHAKGLMDELARIAIVSPYQLETINNTFKTAMAFGWASDEAKSFTNSVLNVAAGVGASNEQMGRMSYNLAQIKMQGRVTAMDIRQLAMAGFDLTGVLKYVGEQMGVQIDDHKDFNKALDRGKITWQDFITNFEKYADENFGGAAKRMSRTLVGLGSTIKDIFALTVPAILGPAAEIFTDFFGGFLDHLFRIRDSGALEQIGENLKTNVEQWLVPFQEFSGRVGEMFRLMFVGKSIETPHGSFKKMKLDFASAFQEAFGDTNFAGILQGLQPITDAFKGMMKPIGKIVSEYGPKFVKLFGERAGVQFEKLGGIAEIVFTKIGEFIEQNKEKFGELFSTFADIFSQLFQIGDAIDSYLGPILADLWDSVLAPLLGNFLDLIGIILDLVSNILAADFEAAFENIKEIVSTAFETIKEFFLTFVNWILDSFFGTDLATVKEQWNTFWTELGAYVNMLFTVKIPAWFGQLRDTLLTAITGASWEELVIGFKNWMLKVKIRWDRFKLDIQLVMIAIKNNIKEKTENIVAFFTNISTAIMGVIDWLETLLTWGKTHVIQFFTSGLPSGGGGGESGRTVYSGRRQHGGTMFSGRNYLIGENGPEILRLPFGQSGQVVSGYDLHASNESKGGNTYQITINARDVDIDEQKLVDLLQSVQFQYA